MKVSDAKSLSHHFISESDDAGRNFCFAVLMHEKIDSFEKKNRFFSEKSYCLHCQDSDAKKIPCF